MLVTARDPVLTEIPQDKRAPILNLQNGAKWRRKSIE
jgi:hypothetical protein